MPQPSPSAGHATRLAAAVAFWAAAVLFVADVSLLSGWLLADAVAATPAAPATEPPTAPATPVVETDSGPVIVDLEGGAEISFPRPPSRSETVIEVAGVDTRTVQHAVTDADGATYTVGTIEYPPVVDVSDPAVNLLASVSGAAGNAGGRVTTQDVTIYDGAPAVEFTIATDAVTLRSRYVLVDHRLYATSVAHPTGAAPVDAQLFLDSLAL